MTRTFVDVSVFHTAEGRDIAKAEAARTLRELAAGLSNGGIVLVRNIGTDEVVVDTAIVDVFLEMAQLLDGQTLEQASAAIA